MESLSNTKMELIIPLLTLIIIIIIISFFFFLKTIKNQNNPNKLNYFSVIKNAHRFFDWSTELLLSSASGPTDTVILPGDMIIFTANPANVEHVIKTNFNNYPKGPTTTGALEDLLGGGIFGSDGEKWRWQRKVAALEFGGKGVRELVVETAKMGVRDRLLPYLEAAARTKQVVDLQDILDRFAFDNVCIVTFGVDMHRLASTTDVEADAFVEAYKSVEKIISNRLRLPSPVWKLARVFGLNAESTLKKDLKVLNHYCTQLIATRKHEESRDGKDFLSRLIAKDEFSDEFLRDFMLNFVLAGKDTTSSALSWLFWLLSHNKEKEEKIVEEVKLAREKRGDEEVFDLEDLKGMNYLHAAVTEAMRLYPPVALQSRYCLSSDVLPDGTRVKEGGMVMHSVYVMGRLKSIWGEDCLEFKPERWLDENEKFRSKDPLHYPVFHAGPRMCLGKDMAYVQMKAVVAGVLERFVVEVTDQGEREMELVLILRMKNGLPIRIYTR